MSELELLEAQHAWWSPLLAVLLIAAALLAAWLLLHGPAYLLAAHRRGLARLRAAKHAQRRREVGR
jgi:hypothetical protein